MVDLTLLPITPIMGSGRAPLQPLEVGDAAQRIAYLSLTEPTQRPVQPLDVGGNEWARPKLSSGRAYTWRAYDAVGPEKMSMLELMENFAKLNGRKLNPVFVDYRNFEMVLNVASLGNLNRQFVSLLRSEQDASRPIVGNPDTFETLLGPKARLFKMQDAMDGRTESANGKIKRRSFPILVTAGWVYSNLGVILPGINLVLETIGTYIFGKRFGSDANWKWVRIGAMSTLLSGLFAGSMHAGAEFGKWYAEISSSGWGPSGFGF